MFRSLLNDQLSPITDQMGFLQCSAFNAATMYHSWKERVYRSRFRIIPITEKGIRNVLLKLLPLARGGARTRTLFLPTDSEWCAYFDNGWQGADVSSAISVLARKYCHCYGMRVCYSPHTMKGKGREATGRWGATMWEVYAPHEINIHNTERVVCAANDGGRWVFETSGKPYDFEHTERYTERRKRDRFTPEMLDEYLHHYGIRAFDEDFYVATKDNPAYLEPIPKPLLRGRL